MKVVREYTFEGPEDWLVKTLKKSLPDGDQAFLHDTRKKITVVTTHSDLPVVVFGTEGVET
jgi:hypothetical protein